MAIIMLKMEIKLIKKNEKKIYKIINSRNLNISEIHKSNTILNNKDNIGILYLKI